MAIAAAFSSQNNSLEFFLDGCPHIISLEEVEITFTDPTCHHGLVFDSQKWMRGLFFGKDTFTFDEPLFAQMQSLASQKPGGLRLWCRVVTRVVNPFPLLQPSSMLTRGADPLHGPGVALKQSLHELSAAEVLRNGVVMLCSDLPTAPAAVSEEVSTFSELSLLTTFTAREPDRPPFRDASVELLSYSHRTLSLQNDFFLSF